MDLYVNDTFIGSEVPRVVIPVDVSKCNTTNPLGNHTHNNMDTTPSLINTCDIMPYLAEATAKAIGDGLAICAISTLPNCNTVSCNVTSKNVTLTYAVLPCHTPPAIQIINRNASGNVTFNVTFVNTTMSVRADILGWESPTFLDVTLVQHRGMLTIGMAVSMVAIISFIVQA